MLVFRFSELKLKSELQTPNIEPSDSRIEKRTSKLKTNSIKQKWSNKEAVLGVISNSSDPTIAELCGWSGLDFYMIDGEHSPVTTSEVQNIVRA